MPGLDGLTLVREYRNHPATQNIPIIVLSTKEDPLIKSAAFSAGANDYLVKLPDNIELVARIRYHSRSYINLLQRDAAYRALRVSQQQLLDTNLVLQRLMNSDGLTGLSNRRHFDEYLELEWRRAMRDQTQLSLLMIDVDFFKTYNDSFGHVEGDEALRKVAASIREASSRPSDLPARYGGEEFVIICPNLPGEQAADVANRICLAVANTGYTLPFGKRVSVTVSIGTASSPPLDLNSRRLLGLADQAMYKAKEQGGNRAV